ncbi:MAG: histidinol-phosphatase [Hyphomicrobiales bacterium]
MAKTPDWTELTRFALTLAEASARAILPYFRRNTPVEVKDGPIWDPVTEGDRAGERAIRALIEGRYPDHGILGEEYGPKAGRSGFTWILDPIDGTRSFVCGMPTWATLIGLSFEEKPVLGVMDQPFVGDRFYGNPAGAWLDHRGDTHPIRTRTGVRLAQATAGTTTPERYRDGGHELAFAGLARAVKLMRYGGDAYFFAVIAAGHLDIALDPDLQPYDIAALIPIIAGAGGVVGSWDGGNPAQGGNIIAAGSQALLDEALATMS